MGLLARIEQGPPERRNPNPKVTPFKERRVPEWRRRAEADFAERGWVAVNDLTDRTAA